MDTGYNIEPHINRGHKPTQAGIQHMPGSKVDERYFCQRHEANEMKRFNSPFRLFVIELDSSMEETKTLFQ